MPEPKDSSNLLVTERGIRSAFVVSGVGMVGLLVLFLVLASTRPQGSFQALDDSQYQATLAAGAERLEGFELIGETGARLDIDHAMELVVERGVDLPMTSQATRAAAVSNGEADAAGDAGAGVAGDASAQAATEADGAAVFAANCAACHQATGQGIPGAFPPLASGHAAELASAEGGRDYLAQVLLYGLQGAIEVTGMTYDGLMPAWLQLSDAEIAAVLNHVVTAWDNADALSAEFEPFAAEEIAAARGAGLAPAAMLELRPTLP
jgi:mono/diheme cytochrome c family protein